jgi:hypothetical protein
VLKAHHTDTSSPEYQGVEAAQSVVGRGVVYRFVETDELRRLLSLMAGTELLTELIQTVFEQ